MVFVLKDERAEKKVVVVTGKKARLVWARLMEGMIKIGEIADTAW